MTTRGHHRICVLCGNAFDGWGNNPEPLADFDDGRCCDTCNEIRVIPARIEHFRQIHPSGGGAT